MIRNPQPINIETRLLQGSAEYFFATYQTHSLLLGTMPQEQPLSGKPQQCTILLAGNIYYKNNKSIFRSYFTTF